MEQEQKKKSISGLAKFGIGCGGLIVLIIIISIASSGGSKSTNTNGASNSNSSNSSSIKTDESKTPKVPAEYKSALNKAATYSNTMHMSKQSVYDQLVSEYGEKFSTAAAQYAIDNVKSDWNANALAKAKTYQNTMSMSPAGIRDQLTSTFGEKFTQSEADYAIEHLND
jgi:hypothetical protein